MLDVVNERLTIEGPHPIAFDSDCREGICGACGVMINGVARGPALATATCQLHMRFFREGDQILVEPGSARAFPAINDLVVDRSAFDGLIHAGVRSAPARAAPPDANAILIGKTAVEAAMDAAVCTGCGACVAVCPNASASLSFGAKITHLGDLPHGQPERGRRAYER